MNYELFRTFALCMKEQSEGSYQHILKYTGLFGGVQGLIILIGLVRNKAMAMLLGAAGMGFNALMMSVQTFASQATNLGLSFGAVPKLSEVYEQNNRSQLDYYIQVIRLWSLIAALNMLLTLWYSYRCQPLKLTFSRRHLRDGYGMIRLGVAFVLAAAIGSGAEMAIRAFLNVEGSMDDVGFYNAAYMITITYAGMVFSAMEADYFPRLSAVNKDINATNETVNKQVEVSLLLLSPMLVAMLMMLPVLIPLLFRHDFLPVVAVAQVAVLAMYFKVQTMPVAYITLARSRSLSYLLLETTYFVVLAVAIVGGYRWWGIWGTGVAILVAHVVEYVAVNAYACWQYSYRSTWRVGCYALLQMSIGALAYAVSLWTDGLAYWITEAALTLVSTACSLYILHRKTHLWEALMRKVKKLV